MGLKSFPPPANGLDLQVPARSSHGDSGGGSPPIPLDGPGRQVSPLPFPTQLSKAPAPRCPGLGVSSPNARFFSDLRVHTKAPGSGSRDPLSPALLPLPRPVFLSTRLSPPGATPAPRPAASRVSPLPRRFLLLSPEAPPLPWTPGPSARPYGGQALSSAATPNTRPLSAPCPQARPIRRPRPYLPSNCWFLPPSLLSDVSRETRRKTLRARESPPRLLPPWPQGRWDT